MMPSSFTTTTSPPPSKTMSNSSDVNNDAGPSSTSSSSSPHRHRRRHEHGLSPRQRRLLQASARARSALLAKKGPSVSPFSPCAVSHSPPSSSSPYSPSITPTELKVPLSPIIHGNSSNSSSSSSPFHSKKALHHDDHDHDELFGTPNNRHHG
eukprot:CAMPEP_0172304684 /NCGR_PEP_ID=MMETSP1058-20130122/6076_1 /TAXON_ID=83371 /ORGANISM="Detonula confervacea, Strain CCMP 353" /LENGTH=152 /DNA_ID=CAMNT_0013016029 /DNA_START=89 /DNA_END=543 /DNA_ORIENTATION=+